MSLFVVVGAGPVGRETARLLAADGHDVRLVSRGGATPDDDHVSGVALDASDGQGLTRVSVGADAIFMCAMAAYTNWPAEFPPIMAGVVTAAEGVRARLVVLGNIYGYGREAPSPLTSAMPPAPTSVKGRVRNSMWEQALGSAVPALEVRASDYLGKGAASLFTLLTLPPLLAGQKATMPGDLDVQHAWSYTKDVARTLVAASRYSGQWGRAFHVPSQHISVRELATRFTERAGAPAPALRALNQEDLVELAREDRFMREIVEMSYLYQDPLVIDSSDTERVLGISASDLDTMIKDTLTLEI